MSQGPLYVLGLMSGTSADGIDSALVRLAESPSLPDVQPAAYHHYPFSAEQRQAIFQLFSTGEVGADRLCQLNFLLGEWFAEAALAAIQAARLSPADVDLIGSHGQTVFHCPPPGPPVDGRVGAIACTLQIGEPAVIAERTGITTVADFRVRDVAAGGHGAPLVSYVDALLFRHPTLARVVLNVGGIANVTLVPPATTVSDAPVAFDTGPGTMVLDWLATQLTGGRQTCDLDGRLAAQGRVHQGLLEELLHDPYFTAPPPKTTGRERFGAPYAQRLWQRAGQLGLGAADAMTTAAALTVEAIARGLLEAGLAASSRVEVIAGGGGTRNTALMAALERRLKATFASAYLTTHEAYGIPNQGKEALSFAILASAALRGMANMIPSCTGARRAVVLGKIVPGENYARLMQGLFGR